MTKHRTCRWRCRKEAEAKNTQTRQEGVRKPSWALTRSGSPTSRRRGLLASGGGAGLSHPPSKGPLCGLPAEAPAVANGGDAGTNAFGYSSGYLRPAAKAGGSPRGCVFGKHPEAVRVWRRVKPMGAVHGWSFLACIPGVAGLNSFEFNRLT